MNEFVVARYKEDTQWVSNLSESFNFKLTVYNKFEGDNRLPNVGFEAHTYLWHIIHRYHTLADITIFCQGKSFDHVQKDKFVRLVQSVDYKNYSSFSQTIYCDINGCPHHCGLEVGRFWDRLFLERRPFRLRFAQGAIFSVPSSVIRKRSIAFYRKAIDLVKTKRDACVMERLWATIFFDSSILFV